MAEVQRVKLLRILFASPTDTGDERAVARRIVEELNQIWGEYAGTSYRALFWEVDSYTGTAEDAQAVINRELGDYQIFVGIMRERFGSPTGRDSSGTKEEYERAFTRLQHKPDSVEIGFYFCNAPVSREGLTTDGLDQIRQVLAFQQEVRERGTLTRDYATIEELATLLRLHLSRMMQQWGARLPVSSGVDSSRLITEAAPAQPAIPMPPVQLLSASTLTEDLVAACAQIARATEIRKEMRAAIEESTRQAVTYSELLNNATASGDQLRILGVLGESHEARAKDLEAVGDAIGSRVITLAQNTRGPLLTGSRVALYTAATGQNVAGARALGNAIEEQREGLDAYLVAVSDWRDSISRIPPWTLKLFRSREYCLHAVDTLLAETRNLSYLAREVASALQTV